MIPKEVFVSVMESLREQMEFDLLQSQKLEEVFGCEVGLYDNSRLQRAVLDILRVWFPKDGDHCELDHFVYELDFGKRWGNEGGEMVLIGREDLGDFWERLQVESGKFEGQVSTNFFEMSKEDQDLWNKKESEWWFEERRGAVESEKKPQSGNSFSNGGAQLRGIEGALGDVGKKSLRDDLDEGLRGEPWLDFRSDLTRGGYNTED